VAIVKSEDARLEEMADPSNWGDVDENDPKSMAKFMRKMKSQLGEDLGPDMDEAIDRMEQGEMPDDILDGDGGGMGEFE
jgi:hypothetical protein